MNSRLTLEAVEAMLAEQRRKASERRRVGVAKASAPAEAAPGGAPVTVRYATVDDATGLRRLAELDSGPVPDLPTLVAEVDGELVAALPLGGGRPVADPFRAAGDFVRLLELRADQLRGDGRRPSRRPRPSPLRLRRGAAGA
jgi:hypothetical protein